MYLRRRIALVVALVLLVSLGFTAYANRGALRNWYEQVAGLDYSGTGSGNVRFVIRDGENGSQIADNLESAGVVKNAATVYRLMMAESTVFYPGVYSLRLKMGSSQALKALTDPASRIVNTVTIKEGLRLGQVLQVLANGTDVSLAEFQRASAQLAELNIPKNAVNAEGFLFPATYTFDPGISATQILRQMVTKTYQVLDAAGVPKSQRFKVLTFASVVEKEARQPQDFYKVARTFQNRLDIGMKLQSDATVSYGSGGTTVTTTDAERADPNGYNTYVHSGLPIGPISAPGERAIDAVLHPADGTWLFFCTINLKTGETVFSTTEAQHYEAVKLFQKWLRENPGWNG
ncbi:MAG: endolytic transglycosylase MltG [Micrococcales bacterium]